MTTAQSTCMRRSPQTTRALSVHTAARFLAAAVALALAVAAAPASGAATDPVTVLRTNWTSRVITNVVEVRVPTNIFVTEYRTNFFTAVHTNVVDVFQTNWVTKTLTNWIPVQLAQTNVFSQYQTNLMTVSLTNWETVLVLKTNRVTQTATNVVAMTPPVDSAAAGIASAGEPVAPAAYGNPVIKATAAGKSAGNNVEVHLTLESPDNPAPALLSQQWKVEREDGSILLFGRDATFKHDLPPGRYQVELTAQVAGKSAPLRLRATLEVTADAVHRRGLAAIVAAQ